MVLSIIMCLMFHRTDNRVLMSLIFFAIKNMVYVGNQALISKNKKCQLSQKLKVTLLCNFSQFILTLSLDLSVFLRN